MRRFTLLPVIGLLFATVGLAFWAGRESNVAHSQLQPFWVHVKAGELKPGKPRTARVAVHDEGRTSFHFDIPEDAVLAEIRLAKAPIDLDFFLTWEREAEDYADADYIAESDDFNEKLKLTPWDDVPLEPGTYHLDVVPAYGSTTRLNGRRMNTAVTFDVQLNVVRSGEPKSLKLGEPQTTSVTAANGHAAVFVVKLDDNSKQLRLDLYDASTSLEMYVGRDRPLLHQDNADVMLDGFETRKFLVLDDKSDPPVEPGELYITVVDRYQADSPMEFTLLARPVDEPPASLQAIPALQASDDPWENALLATVELINSGGGGSGAIVTPQGLIMTNYHVIVEPNGELPKENGLIVSLTIDPTKPPVDLYRGSVVRADETLDLALVQITGGFYGQPLAPKTRFPFVKLRPDTLPRIGDSLSVVGYPWIGGAMGRVSLTAARGIVSGFDRHGAVAMIKTDADFHPGHSGGPVLDDQHRLFGIASETIEEELAAGKIGFVRPIDSLPAEWRTLLKVEP